MLTVQQIRLAVANDDRGMLSAAQFPGHLPFEPTRVFIITSSPAGTERGGHAHRVCHQFLVATAGSIRVDFQDATGSGQVDLYDPSVGLYIPPLVWAKQTYIDYGASLVVLASHAYDAADYVDDAATAKKLREQSSHANR